MTGRRSLCLCVVSAAMLAAGCASSARRSEPEPSALPPSAAQPRGDEQTPLSEMAPPADEGTAQETVPTPDQGSDAAKHIVLPSQTPMEQEENAALAAYGFPAPQEHAAEPQLSAEQAAEKLLHPCAQLVEADESMLDETRRLLVETTCSAALWTDSLFGGIGDVEAARKVHGHVELSGGYSQFEGSRIRFRFDARAELPTLKHRFNAFIGRDNENDFLRDRSEGFALRSQFPRLDDREGWLGGLGYSLPETDRLRSEFRVGVHGLNPPQVFLQWRTRYNIYANENNIIYIRGTPFWNSDDGVGVTTNFDVSHILSPTRLLRFSSAATRSQRTSGVDWRGALIHYQNLRLGRAIAFEGFVRGSTQAPEPLGEYGVRTIYRHPLVDQKLFAEAILGYGWPRDDPALPRKGSVGVGLSINMPFGKTP